MTAAETIPLRVPADAAGQRLDRFLAAALEGFSRNRLQALIADGRLAGADGRPITDPARKVRGGENLILAVPPPAPATPEAEAIPLDVLYEDDHLIVLDKPPGLVVHPAPGHASGTLVNALLHHCRGSLSGIGGVTRPGIVHRLDKDTAGIMVCAKSDLAHRGLVQQFQVHSIDRAYWAVVWGVPDPRRGRIETLIGRDPRNRKRMAVVTRGGKEAITDYRVEKAIDGLAALVDCRLMTGRTHQIRVHMTSIGHPLIGDPLYRRGDVAKRVRDPVIQSALGAYKNQALQAYKLGFTHPVTGKELTFQRELSIKIKELLQTLEAV